MRTLRAWGARLDTTVRRFSRLPALVDEEVTHEIILFVDKTGRVHIHYPAPTNKEAMIQTANTLLIASQVMAAQAGAQIVSHATSKGS